MLSLTKIKSFRISKACHLIFKNMKTKAIFTSTLLLLLPFFVVSCVTTPPKTSLELQAFQKKSFEASKSVAFSSTMSVFQDLGYIIKAADKDTGLIQAASPTKSIQLFGSHMSNTQATAFVEQVNSTTSSIRLSFVKVNESSSGYGMKSKSDTPVEKPEVYSNAFTKIQGAIFVRKNNQ